MTTTIDERPLYPHIRVRLVGQHKSDISPLLRVAEALRKARVPEDEIEKFYREGVSGDFYHLLWTCMRWVNVH